MALDKKDWKILAELSKDCRISLTQLGKKAGVSREVADYRVRRLVKQGIIKAFCIDVDIEKLGYTKHVVYLELRNIDKKKEKEIFKVLEKNKFVSWLVTSTGKWSIIFDLHSKDNQHLSQLIKELKQELGVYFGKYDISTLDDYSYFHSKFFGGKEKTKKASKEGTTLDEVDLKILRTLRDNARMDYMQLSKRVGLTAEAISRRIKRLKETNVIKQFYIFPDLTKLGFEHYNIQINLENISNEKERGVMHYLENHELVSFIYKPIAHWDVEFGLFVKNPGELRDFLLELRTLHPQNVRIKDVVLFYEELLPNFLPEGVF